MCVCEVYPISWILGRLRYDKTNSTSLEFKRECFYVLWNGWEGGLYSSGEENMNGNAFNDGWLRIRENHEPRPNFWV